MWWQHPMNNFTSINQDQNIYQILCVYADIYHSNQTMMLALTYKEFL